MNTVTVINEAGDKRYELANHLGNVLNVVTDRKLVQAGSVETIFDDKFTTPGNLLGWHYDETATGSPVPSGYSLSNPSGKLVVNTGAAGSFSGVFKNVVFQAGVHYTLTFDVVLPTENAAVIGGSNASTLLLGDIFSSGSYTFNFVGDGTSGYIAFAMAPNLTYQFDNVKLVANDVRLVTADVKSYSDYYPYGMKLPYRNGDEGDYRYGFNGMEIDNEMKVGDGNSYDFGARMYDPRVGRWLSKDPDFTDYASISPYAFAINNPIWFIDPNGKWVAKIVPNPNDGKYEVVFSAEEGDNLEVLATQLGLSKDAILKKHPELENLQVTTKMELKLENLDQVKNINAGINYIKANQGITNCANLADNCDGGSAGKDVKVKIGSDGVTEFENKIGNTYEALPDEKAQIGDVLMYEIGDQYLNEYNKYNEDACKDLFSGNPQKTQECIEKRGAYPPTLYKREKHFAIVILKDKSGKAPIQIIQKNGTVNFDFKVDSADDLRVGNKPVDLIYERVDPSSCKSPSSENQTPSVYRNTTP